MKRAIGYNELGEVLSSDCNLDEFYEKLPPAPDCAECVYGDRGAPRGNLPELALEVRQLKEKCDYLSPGSQMAGRMDSLLLKLERKAEGNTNNQAVIEDKLKPVDQDAWRLVWEAAKELWLIRSSQAMSTPYPAVKEAVMPEFEQLKAALDKTEPKL